MNQKLWDQGLGKLQSFMLLQWNLKLKTLKWFLRCEPATAVATLPFCLQPELLRVPRLPVGRAPPHISPSSCPREWLRLRDLKIDSIKMKRSVNSHLANFTQISKYLDVTEILHWILIANINACQYRNFYTLRANVNFSRGYLAPCDLMSNSSSDSTINSFIHSFAIK